MVALAVAFVGVLATSLAVVAERRRDLAIRAALGASQGQLVWTIVGKGLLLTAVGLVLGVGLGAATARSLASFVYDVGPYDAVTFIGTIVIIGGGATGMTYAAGLYAQTVDPLVILKHE